MNGMFDLTGFEHKNDTDDILAQKFNESTEFLNNGNATNDVDTGTKDATVSIPGGDKETPTSKPEGGEKSVPIPGGDKETPTSKPYDNTIVPIPGKLELTEDEYNKYLKQSQQSLKESAEIAMMLAGANVVRKTTEELQDEIVENAMVEAMIESLESGPMFEAVDRSDKNDVKKIVKSLRSKMPDEFKSNGMKFYTIKVMGSVLKNVIIGAAVGAAKGFSGGPASAVVGAVNGAVNGAGMGVATFFKTRLWQILGMCYIEDANIKDLTSSLTEKYKNELGEYKIIYSPLTPNLTDMFKTKFGWKNEKKAYMLLIDKKLPIEIKEALKELDQSIEDNEEGKDKKDKGDK